MIGLLRTLFGRRQPSPPPVFEIDQASVDAAVAADRARCLAIMELAEAVDYQMLASALAHETDIDVTIARRLLRVAAGFPSDVSDEARARCGRQLVGDPDFPLAPHPVAKHEAAT